MDILVAIPNEVGIVAMLEKLGRTFGERYPEIARLRPLTNGRKASCSAEAQRWFGCQVEPGGGRSGPGVVGVGAGSPAESPTEKTRQNGAGHARPA